MYDRAPRVLSRPYGSTAPGVGPGTYHTARKTSGGMSRNGSSWHKLFCIPGVV